MTLPPTENGPRGIWDAGGNSRGSSPMSTTIEISDDLSARLENHLDEDETLEAFIAELLSMYETEGTFLQEGYSE